MKRCFVMAVAVLTLAGSAPATLLIGRNGAVSKPLQALAWLNVGYNKQARSYSWLDEKYEGLGEADPVTTYGADVIAGLGLPAGLEVDASIPAWMKKQGDSTSRGIGDATAMVRYGLPIPGVVPLKVALAAAVNVPTSIKDLGPDVRLGDRTLDVGFGVNAVTGKLGPIAGHVRAGYWLNGKTDDTTKVGDMVEYMVVLDYYLSKMLIPELAVTGFAQGKRELSGGKLPNTDLSQHLASLLLMTRPLPFLVIRPKVSVPLEFISKGGKLASFYPGLDIWVTLP